MNGSFSLRIDLKYKANTLKTFNLLLCKGLAAIIQPHKPSLYLTFIYIYIKATKSLKLQTNINFYGTFSHELNSIKSSTAILCRVCD